MTARASLKSRRRTAKAVATAHRSPSHSLTAGIVRAATSRPARLAYVAIGTAGLAALTVALVGPKRIEREVIKPLRDAVEPQAEKLWSDSRQLREQIAGLFRRATPGNREKLARNFQSWLGHFHAT
jgi:NAD/NADP transhydrogenase alpha subunit